MTVLSDWVVYKRISCWNIQHPFFFFSPKTNTKTTQILGGEGVGRCDLVQFVLNLNGESSGCGGRIRYVFPRSFSTSSSEMFQVLCDFTLSLISPAVSLFEQFFWKVTDNNNNYLKKKNKAWIKGFGKENCQ